MQAHTYERVVESTELTQLKRDTGATRNVEMIKAEGAGRQGTCEAEGAGRTRLKMDQMWPGTREWEAAVQAHTYEQEVESKELTPHKMDQVWPGTREGEVAVKAHTYEQVVEGTELTQLMLDTEATRDVNMYKAKGAGRLSVYKAEGAGRQGRNKDEGTGRQGTYKAKGASVRV